MTKRELLVIAAVLLAAAVALHGLHWLIFREAHHIFIYLLGDIAFVPLEVLLVTVVVDRLLAKRERESIRHKMNMVIGTFFSTLGRPLLERVDAVLANADEVHAVAAVAPGWSEGQIRAAKDAVAGIRLRVRPEIEDIEALGAVLTPNRDFLLMLLQNSALLEDDDFADLLWALTHLQEELAARGDLHHLPESDLHHLYGDIYRAYGHLLREWLEYMAHLNARYPFLYSFAARTNPLRADPCVTVTE